MGVFLIFSRADNSMEKAIFFHSTAVTMTTLLGNNSNINQCLSHFFSLPGSVNHHDGMTSHLSSFFLTIVLPNQDVKKRKHCFKYNTFELKYVTVNDISNTI